MKKKVTHNSTTRTGHCWHLKYFQSYIKIKGESSSIYYIRLCIFLSSHNISWALSCVIRNSFHSPTLLLNAGVTPTFTPTSAAPRMPACPGPRPTSGDLLGMNSGTRQSCRGGSRGGMSSSTVPRWTSVFPSCTISTGMRILFFQESSPIPLSPVK